ncbi:AAA family ATPase [Lichenibacterium ramalinae]|uniref:AAA family ATPase n=1 Tax=Lichenibacterium ramalinae TaxID=2316527 RepID=UPI0013ED3C84|nr:AAA family ATPase [Lichenibacterium ramalinae]
MTSAIEHLTVEDFRSIRGHVSLSLDAPVVLIHGQNGTGKTSLMAAIELALTGDVPSMSRVEPDYLKYLPHQAVGTGSVRLRTRMAGGIGETSLKVTSAGVEGAPALGGRLARFYGERCYLSQATLGRLLEIYEAPDGKSGPSALQRFVKDLLGLDRLDALTDGLRTAGNVLRLREPVPQYAAAKDEIPRLRDRLRADRAGVAASEADLELAKEQLRLFIAGIDEGLTILLDDRERLAQRLKEQSEEPSLLQQARLRRRIAVAMEEWGVLSGADAMIALTVVQAEHRANDSALRAWRDGVGGELENVLGHIGRALGIAENPADVTYQHACRVASARVDAEVARCTEVLNGHDIDHTRLEQIASDIRSGQARLALLDRSVGESVGVAQQLARALTQVVPHVHEDDCPVCGRNFREVSSVPLAAHLSRRIAALTQEAGRLEAVAKDRSTTASALLQAERERDAVSGRLVEDGVRDALKERRATLSEARLALESRMVEAAEGDRLRSKAQASEKRLAEFAGRDNAVSTLREIASDLAVQAGEAPLGTDDAIGDALSQLASTVAQREASLAERQESRRKATLALVSLRAIDAKLKSAREALETQQRAFDRLEKAKDEADRRIELAKGLIRTVNESRSRIVRKVFDERLNAVWRELFIRLAPEEPFVPAFAMPSRIGTVMEAKLETIYRQGRKGGNPKAMLSAGNLNTAALTLFLALNLSVEPDLPWLLIDDPVQNMDDVHISQFAALLRTLKRQHGRRVVLAVHDRALFEYLALELSPTFVGDRLIKVELGRSMHGETTCSWEPVIYEEDNAIAA